MLTQRRRPEGSSPQQKCVKWAWATALLLHKISSGPCVAEFAVLEQGDNHGSVGVISACKVVSLP
jgi:hypothetical protein